MIKIIDAVFVTTATKPEQYPNARLAEIAFVGRSNVGKSSMLNALARRKKLVRVSNTPGRTKTLNFFDVTIERSPKRQTLRFCDLPGYGFAKVSKTERAEWKTMIGDYLQHRENLKIVVCIVDAEVGPTADDIQMIDFLEETKAAILVVATKIDRISKGNRFGRLQKISKQLELPAEAVFAFSATEGLGVEEVWKRLVAQAAIDEA